MIVFRDRDGKPIDTSDRERMLRVEGLLRDESYRRVGSTRIEGDSGSRWVSTVWTGVDYAWNSGPPEIFEAMVFVGPGPEDMGRDVCQVRYATEEDARRGHRAVVAEYTGEAGPGAIVTELTR